MLKLWLRGFDRGARQVIVTFRHYSFSGDSEVTPVIQTLESFTCVFAYILAKEKEEGVVPHQDFNSHEREQEQYEQHIELRLSIMLVCVRLRHCHSTTLVLLLLKRLFPAVLALFHVSCNLGERRLPSPSPWPKWVQRHT